MQASYSLIPTLKTIQRPQLFRALFQIDSSLFFSVFITTFLLLSPDTALAAKPDAFCRVLKNIITSGQNKFQSLKGKLDLVSEEHWGIVIPPGYKTCFAWRDGKGYHCEGHDGLSAEGVAQVYEKQIETFQYCLSERWEKKETNSKRVNGRRIATFTSPTNIIEIKIGERQKRQGWFVDLYFRR